MITTLFNEKSFIDLGKKFYDIVLRTGQIIKSYTSLDNAIKIAKLKNALQIFDTEDRSIVWSVFSLEQKYIEDYEVSNQCKYFRKDIEDYEVSNQCKYFRKDIETCRIGCRESGIEKGGNCYWAYDDNEAKIECKCYTR